MSSDRMDKSNPRDKLARSDAKIFAPKYPSQSPNHKNPSSQPLAHNHNPIQSSNHQGPSTQSPTNQSPATQSPTTQSPTTHHPTTQSPSPSHPISHNLPHTSPTVDKPLQDHPSTPGEGKSNAKKILHSRPHPSTIKEPRGNTTKNNNKNNKFLQNEIHPGTSKNKQLEGEKHQMKMIQEFAVPLNEGDLVVDNYSPPIKPSDTKETHLLESIPIQLEETHIVGENKTELGDSDEQVHQDIILEDDVVQQLEQNLHLILGYVPSIDAPLRSHIYVSPNYLTAEKVIVFVGDDSPLGYWRKMEKDQNLINSSMIAYLVRAREEGHGVIVTNPYCNTATVIEEGGTERVVAIPGSSNCQEHMDSIWEHIVPKCSGVVSIIAYGKGGTLVTSLFQRQEASCRSKLLRVAFIESNHLVDVSLFHRGVLEILGKRTINWKFSPGESNDIGNQVTVSENRLGCVCLSLGMDTISTGFSNAKQIDAIFAFLNVNPSCPGILPIIEAIRRQKNSTSTLDIDHAIPSSNEENLVLMENNLMNGDSPSSSYSPIYIPNKFNPMEHVTTDDFEILQCVGQGGFGRVYLVQKTTDPNKGEFYAMKVAKKKQIIDSGGVLKAMAERHILRELSHPFIVKLHYSFQTPSKLYLVMEYLSGGPLSHHLHQRNRFPENWVQFYGAQVAAAIGHLHSYDILYRDVKKENVLLDHEGNIKLADFGLSKLGISSLQKASSFCGTPTYLAPEIWKGESYGRGADWWAFGVLLYEMINGKPPYYHKNPQVLRDTVLKKEWVTFTSVFSKNAVDLIRRLLIRDPQQRLGSSGVDEVTQHPFFENVDWVALLNKKTTPPFIPQVHVADTKFVSERFLQIVPIDRQNSASSPPVPGDLFHGFSYNEKH